MAFDLWHNVRKAFNAMKVKFTYKEVTLLAGVVVAIIIMLALWLQPASAEGGEVSRKKLIPPVSKPAAKAVAEKTLIILQRTIE